MINTTSRRKCSTVPSPEAFGDPGSRRSQFGHGGRFAGSRHSTRRGDLGAKPAMPLDPHTQVMQTRSTRSFCPEGLPSTLFVGSCAGQQSVSSQQTTPAQEKPVSIRVKTTTPHWIDFITVLRCLLYCVVEYPRDESLILKKN